MADNGKNPPEVFEFRKGAGIVNIMPSPAQLIRTEPEAPTQELAEEKD